MHDKYFDNAYFYTLRNIVALAVWREEGEHDGSLKILKLILNLAMSLHAALYFSVSKKLPNQTWILPHLGRLYM